MKLHQFKLIKIGILICVAMNMISCGKKSEDQAKVQQGHFYVSCDKECTYNERNHKMPNDVLVGTDFVSTTTFETAPHLQPEYHAETGGASLSISIQPKEGHFKLTRMYNEPGLDVQTKDYYPLHLKDGFLLGKDFIGWSVGGWSEVGSGLIIWENDSGVDSIPADFAIWYEISTTQKKIE